MEKKDFNSNSSATSSLYQLDNTSPYRLKKEDTQDPKILQLFHIIRNDYIQSIKIENYKEVKQVCVFSELLANLLPHHDIQADL